MGTPSTISVDDDLPTSKSSISLGTTNNELARGIDVEVRVVAIQGQRGFATLQFNLLETFNDHLLHNEVVHIIHAGCNGLFPLPTCHLLAALGLGGLRVLSGDHDCV